MSRDNSLFCLHMNRITGRRCTSHRLFGVSDIEGRETFVCDSCSMRIVVPGMFKGEEKRLQLCLPL